MKRTMIEKLRPSLLDNFGLFAALRWLMKNACRKQDLACTQSYPSEEASFKPSASIAIYRVVQDAIGVVLADDSCSAVDLRVTSEGDTIHFRVTGDGAAWDERLGEDRESYVLASMQHRARSLGGEIAITRVPRSRLLQITVSIPLANAVAAADANGV
jgi:signal transduction histidine kinase